MLHDCAAGGFILRRVRKFCAAEPAGEPDFLYRRANKPAAGAVYTAIASKRWRAK
jgi:hypothetical protein